MSARTWFTYHSATHHLIVPVWARVPERTRWRIANLLDRSKRLCWVDLVDAAMTPRDGSDACDGHFPLSGTSAPCRDRCGWMHEHTDHTDCTCYCGKFRLGHLNGGES